MDMRGAWRLCGGNGRLEFLWRVGFTPWLIDGSFDICKMHPCRMPTKMITAHPLGISYALASCLNRGTRTYGANASHHKPKTAMLNARMFLQGADLLEPLSFSVEVPTGNAPKAKTSGRRPIDTSSLSCGCRHRSSIRHLLILGAWRLAWCCGWR